MVAGALRLLRFVWHHPLNAHARVAALARVLRWQLRSRLQAGPIVLPFVNGTRLCVRRGMHGATGNWYCGLHEPAAMAFTLHVLRPGDLFVDAGANIGSYTMLAAGVAGAQAIAVEPVPETFAALQANVQLNGLAGRVRCCAIGLSSAAGTLRFSADRGSENRVIAGEVGGAGVDVAVMRLDELLDDAVPALIKIDVEGHELAVLHGAGQALADPRLKALIIETDPQRGAAPGDDAALRALLADSGFSPMDYDYRVRSLRPMAAADRNTIFVRDIDWAAQRVRQAARFRLVNGTL